uniref:Uncharacterized protein n=1 Tax=Leptobrachium leishanense TaxID=445787 RepID=A0A8C5WC87_9ANUR
RPRHAPSCPGPPRSPPAPHPPPERTKRNDASGAGARPRARVAARSLVPPPGRGEAAGSRRWGTTAERGGLRRAGGASSSRGACLATLRALLYILCRSWVLPVCGSPPPPVYLCHTPLLQYTVCLTQYTLRCTLYTVTDCSHEDGHPAVNSKEMQTLLHFPAENVIIWAEPFQGFKRISLRIAQIYGSNRTDETIPFYCISLAVSKRRSRPSRRSPKRGMGGIHNLDEVEIEDRAFK